MRKISLRAKLMWVCATLVLVPMAIVSVYALVQLGDFSNAATGEAREGLVNQAKDLLATGTEATWEEIAAALASADKDARQLADSGNVRGYMLSRAGRNKVFNDITMREVARVAEGIAIACEAENKASGGKATGNMESVVAQRLLNIKVGETGYAFVVNSQGKTLVHPNPQVLGKDLVNDLGLKEFTPVLRNRKAGQVQTMPYVFEGRAKIVAYTYYEPWDWVVCAGAYLDDLSADAAQASLAFLRSDMEALYGNAVIHAKAQTLPVYSQIRLLDANGQELVKLMDGKFSESLTGKGNTDWFKTTRQTARGEVVNSGCVVAANTGEPELRLIVPIHDAGEFLGAVALNVDWSAISAVVGKRVFGKTGYAYIINEKGILISHPKYGLKDQKGLASGTDELANLVRSEMLQGKAGVGQYAFEGQDKYAAYRPLQVGAHNYSLVATSFTSEFLAVADSIEKQATSMFASTRLSLIIAGVILVVIGIFIGLLFANGLSKSLMEIVQVLSGASEQVTAASGQISHSSQELAEGSTEQAASLEESSSALEQLASQARGNSEKAQKAAEGADSMQNGAQGASRAMEQTVEAMNAIKESSDKVSGIVRSIEEIAFQTNLLALNAAVEAARAGEHGKGFAVVAEEVRNLAQRAAQSARDTSEIIGQSVEQSNRGAEVVQQAAEALSQIREQSETVAGIAREVLTASNEQGQGIEQINIAVAQMDQVTQRVAANAEESASASEELSAQASQMDSVVRDLDGLVTGAGNGGGHGVHEQHQLAVAHRRPAPAAAIAHRPKKQEKAKAEIPFDEHEDGDISKDF